MPADVPDNPPASAPPELQALWPFVRDFGYSDDVERGEALAGASDATLTNFVGSIDKHLFDLINEYLDSTDNSEESVPFGDLAQAAMEASMELKSRGIGT